LLEIQLLRASLHVRAGFKCGLAAYIACLCPVRAPVQAGSLYARDFRAFFTGDAAAHGRCRETGSDPCS
jgi:hypothetical protein